MARKRNKIKGEKVLIEAMIRMYCKAKCKTNILCKECAELLEYAQKRLEHCRWKEDKPACKKCPTHCYKKDMKEKIRVVMRYAGPRIIFKHPVLSLKHWG